MAKKVYILISYKIYFMYVGLIAKYYYLYKLQDIQVKKLSFSWGYLEVNPIFQSFLQNIIVKCCMLIFFLTYSMYKWR